MIPSPGVVAARLTALLGLWLASLGCAGVRPGSLAVERYAVGPQPHRALFVFFPGRWDVPQDFVRHGFLAELEAGGWAAEVWAADLSVEYYRHGAVGEVAGQLLASVPEGLRPCTFVVGISMGGMGAIIADSAHPGPWKIVLLAPYLGSPKAGAKKLREGTPTLGGGNPFAGQLEAWLASSSAANRVWLGFGDNDPYALAHRYLAARLPQGQVVHIPGGHDWPTWRRLFRLLLERLPREACGPKAAGAAGGSPEPGPRRYELQGPSGVSCLGLTATKLMFLAPTRRAVSKTFMTVP
ncbi:MAG: hypothetical protein ACP5NF_04050 [Thermoanaerobaculum sp.]